jgi:hypothetical protein
VKYEVELQYSVEARDGRTMFVRRVACSFPVFPGLELVVADEFHLVERVQYAPESGARGRCPRGCARRRP